jgi:hypothetical protein
MKRKTVAMAPIVAVAARAFTTFAFAIPQQAFAHYGDRKIRETLCTTPHCIWMMSRENFILL